MQQTFRVTGMDLSGYMVKDTARAIAFYRDVLGLEPTTVFPEDNGAEYELSDGTTFGLWNGRDMMPFQPSNGILFATDDLDAARDAIEAHNLPIVMEHDGPVCNMLMIQDTEGNSVILHKRKPSAA